MSYKNYLEDALALVEHAEESLLEVKVLYENSITNKKIDKRLSINIKNILENLRSSLDYSANALVDLYSDNKPYKVYFPYASFKTTKEEFLNERLRKYIPGLETKSPELFNAIVKMQHFSHPGAKWFPEFMELNNKYKHIHLVPSIINEGVKLNVGNSIISAKSICIGPKGSIAIGNDVINGPAEITPETLEKYKAKGMKIVKWKAIFIDGYGYPKNAFQFTEHCVKAISSIVKWFDKKMP